MVAATLTSKGQITIPNAIRKNMALSQETELSFGKNLMEFKLCGQLTRRLAASQDDSQTEKTNFTE